MRLAFVCILATATPALADDYVPAAAPTPPAAAPAPLATTSQAPRTKTLGIDGAAIMPIGDYADAAAAGVGVLARLEVPLGTGFLTGRLGIIGHAMQDNVAASLYFVPAYVGYRHPVGTGGAYIAGELGITFGYASADTQQFGTVSDSDSELGFTLTAGMRRGALDLRAGLFAPDADDIHGVMGSLGFDFAAL